MRLQAEKEVGRMTLVVDVECLPLPWSFSGLAQPTWGSWYGQLGPPIGRFGPKAQAGLHLDKCGEYGLILTRSGHRFVMLWVMWGKGRQGGDGASTGRPDRERDGGTHGTHFRKLNMEYDLNGLRNGMTT